MVFKLRYFANCKWLNFNADYQFNLLMTPYIAKTQKSKLIFNSVILMVLGQVAKLNSILLYFHHVRCADSYSFGMTSIRAKDPFCQLLAQKKKTSKKAKAFLLLFMGSSFDNSYPVDLGKKCEHCHHQLSAIILL